MGATPSPRGHDVLIDHPGRHSFVGQKRCKSFRHLSIRWDVCANVWIEHHPVAANWARYRVVKEHPVHPKTQRARRWPLVAEHPRNNLCACCSEIPKKAQPDRVLGLGHNDSWTLAITGITDFPRRKLNRSEIFESGRLPNSSSIIPASTECAFRSKVEAADRLKSSSPKAPYIAENTFARFLMSALGCSARGREAECLAVWPCS